MPSNDITKINERIVKIRDFYGMQPITLKSEFDIMRLVIYPKGSSREGEIMSYNEANRIYQINNNGKSLPLSIYTDVISDITDTEKPFYRETYINYQLSKAKSSAESTAETMNEHGILTDYEFEKIMSLSRMKKIQLMQKLGERLNSVKGTNEYDSDMIISQVLAEFDIIDEWR